MWNSPAAKPLRTRETLVRRPVFNIIVRGTYNRPCPFPSNRLKQALKAHGRFGRAGLLPLVFVGGSGRV